MEQVLDNCNNVFLTRFFDSYVRCLRYSVVFVIGTSSRNSEVIHAGIYYPTGSLKAKMCVTGKRSLYDYLKSRSIPFNQCGKLVIASTEAEVVQLSSVLKQATANGAEMFFLDSQEAKAMEPAVKCLKALYSPTTGIFDSHIYMQHLQGDAEEAGAIFVHNCTVISSTCPQSDIRLAADGQGITLQTNQGAITADVVINAAGLHSIEFVERLSGFPKENIPRAYYAKGNYFSLDPSLSCPFSRLVYPLPEASGLGIHATIDMAGSVRFGPDVEWIKENKDNMLFNSSLGKDGVNASDQEDLYRHWGSVPSNYEVDAARSGTFVKAIQKYWPDVTSDSLIPAYSGIRPKLFGPSGIPDSHSIHERNLRDFVIEGPRSHGVQGLVNLFGIESPGLTSSLAIADYVVELLHMNSDKLDRRQSV